MRTRASLVVLTVIACSAALANPTSAPRTRNQRTHIAAHQANGRLVARAGTRRRPSRPQPATYVEWWRTSPLSPWLLTVDLSTDTHMIGERGLPACPTGVEPHVRVGDITTLSYDERDFALLQAPPFVPVFDGRWQDGPTTLFDRYMIYGTRCLAVDERNQVVAYKLNVYYRPVHMFLRWAGHFRQKLGTPVTAWKREADGSGPAMQSIGWAWGEPTGPTLDDRMKVRVTLTYVAGGKVKRGPVMTWFPERTYLLIGTSGGTAFLSRSPALGE